MYYTKADASSQGELQFNRDYLNTANENAATDDDDDDKEDEGKMKLIKLTQSLRERFQMMQ